MVIFLEPSFSLVKMSQTQIVDYVFYSCYMAYGRRSTYRRKGRRGNRSLTTRRIFNNKGAKAQAKQIYALKRAVNRVRAQCKPEVKYVKSETQNRALGLEHQGASFLQYYAQLPMPGISAGTGDGNRIGDNVRLLPMKLGINIRYEEYMNSLTKTYPVDIPLNSTGGQVRIIAVQAITAHSNEPQLVDLMNANEYNMGAIGAAGMMNMSFKRGITSHYKILMNKVVTVSKDRPIVNKRYLIRPAIKHLKVGRRTDST
ncbi:putative capsid protein [Odonata-associated circular virus-17]|uniref:putative capsid protein n=1 Tax=Odonata-associated circular virus-17 TaxID=1592117 RepID=UPI00058630E0|nr:putative capsid protein [Odonata-associated circular virus-17]AJD07491.1 putative capsid protein [Odonata-associated circular virus-17]